MEKTIQLTESEISAIRVAIVIRIFNIENALKTGAWKDKADAHWNIMNLQQFLDKTETT